MWSLRCQGQRSELGSVDVIELFDKYLCGTKCVPVLGTQQEIPHTSLSPGTVFPEGHLQMKWTT